MSDIFVKIKGTSEGLKAACKEAVRQAKDSSLKITEEFKKAKAAASSVGGPAGSAGGKAFGAAGLGGMGLGGAAVGAGMAVANLAIKAYEQYREEAEQAARAAQMQAEAEDRRTQKLTASIRANEAAAAALDKYAGLGEMTNVQILEATKLLDALGKSYGDLGLTIDDVRNKTDAYIAAQAAMAERNKKTKMDAIGSQIAALKTAMAQTRDLRDEADSVLGRIRPGGAGKVEEYDRQLDSMREKLHALLRQQRELSESDPGGDVRKRAEAERADAIAKKQKEAAEAERKAAEAKAEAERKAAEEKLKLEEKATREYERQMELLKLQREGKDREAAMRQAEWRAEDQFGALTEEQRTLARERAGNIWDAQQKEEEPTVKAFKALENARVPEITNSLQRIGALGGAANGIDYTKSTAQTAKDILDAVTKIANKPAETQSSGMTF